MSEQVNAAALALSREQLEDVRAALAARIREGLDVEGAEIKALPSFYAPPKPNLRGRALVIDTGGTNMRAAVVELSEPGRSRILAGPVQRRLAVREGAQTTASEFFRAQAELAEELEPEPGLAVGYCFSYPSEIAPNRDGRLIRWTKGIDIPGVPGTFVGEQLGAALRNVGLAPRSVRVLNDTVASMLGGAWMHPESSSDRFIGLIVGTGTNMAAFFGPNRSKKIPADWRKMAVNLESGNFTPPHLTRWDDAVDAASDNPGAQRFEKAVSGHYLPYVFARVLPNQPGFNPAQGTKLLVQHRDSGLEEDAVAVAGALLTRSADFVAAGLAAVLDLYDHSKAPAGILAEGSLFWSDPLYAPRVLDTLGRMTGLPDAVRLHRVDSANLIGSAAAALGCEP